LQETQNIDANIWCNEPNLSLEMFGNCQSPP